MSSYARYFWPYPESGFIGCHSSTGVIPVFAGMTHFHEDFSNLTVTWVENTQSKALLSFDDDPFTHIV